MQLVARLKTKCEIETFHQLGVDVLSLDTIFSIHKLTYYHPCDIEAVIALAKPKGLKLYLNVNQMMHEKDLSSLRLFLREVKAMEIDGIVINDLTVFVIAKELGIENKIIYQPGTMNTDSFSIEYFQIHPIKGITLSREITLQEIQTVSMNLNHLELSLIGHGYLDMFYSKRKLLTNYFKHAGLIGKVKLNKHQFRLSEEMRKEDFYPIVEDEFGTHIFRSHKLISIQELNVLEPLLSDFFLERLFLEDEEYYDSIRLYKGKMTEAEFLQRYQNYESGFYYQPTELIKGDNDES